MPSSSTEAQKNGQPLRSGWTPTTDFEFPHDPLSLSVREWLAKYGANLSDQNVVWLSEFIGDFISNELNLISRTRLNAEFKIAARRLIKILCVIDEVMDDPDPARKWREVSLALGLPSACYNGLTQAEIGQRHGLTKMGVSKAMHRLAQACGLEPAFGQGRSGFQNLQ